jgi:hypothetical protein
MDRTEVVSRLANLAETLSVVMFSDEAELVRVPGTARELLELNGALKGRVKVRRKALDVSLAQLARAQAQLRSEKFSDRGSPSPVGLEQRSVGFQCRPSKRGCRRGGSPRRRSTATERSPKSPRRSSGTWRTGSCWPGSTSPRLPRRSSLSSAGRAPRDHSSSISPATGWAGCGWWGSLGQIPDPFRDHAIAMAMKVVDCGAVPANPGPLGAGPRAGMMAPCCFASCPSRSRP